VYVYAEDGSIPTPNSNTKGPFYFNVEPLPEGETIESEEIEEIEEEIEEEQEEI